LVFKDWTDFSGLVGLDELRKDLGFVFLLDVGFCFFYRMLDFYISVISKIKKEEVD